MEQEYLGLTNRVCGNCKKEIKSGEKFFVFQFNNGVGVEQCSLTCGTEYKEKMKKQRLKGKLK